MSASSDELCCTYHQGNSLHGTCLQSQWMNVLIVESSWNIRYDRIVPNFNKMESTGKYIVCKNCDPQKSAELRSMFDRVKQVLIDLGLHH